MKSRALFLSIFLSLAVFTIACSSDEAEPTATAIPTAEPAASEPEDAVPEPVEDADTEPIRIGVFTDSVPPFVILEGGTYTGFEIDIATEIVARLYGSEATIEWVPTTGQERWTSLADGQIDMLVRGALHTTSREELVLFSGGYLLSGNGFMVFEEAGFSSFADLDGENVAVLGNRVEGLTAAADELGYAITPIVFEDLDEAQGALGFGRAAALYHDWILLTGIMDISVHAILIEGSQLGPIGVAFPLDKQALRDEVDSILKEMIADGTWQSIFDEWFGIPVPWNVDEMFAYPPENR